MLPPENTVVDGFLGICIGRMWYIIVMTLRDEVWNLFCCRMAALPIKPGKVGVEETIEQVHRIRITLSSKNVKNLEKGKSSRAVPNIFKSNFLCCPF